MFIPHKTDDGRVPAWEYMAAGAITPKVGLALNFSAGNLVVATGKPDYICMRDEEAAVAAGTIIPVIAVSPGIEFATTNSAALTSVKVGDKVTISTDGTQVTATTASGVARILYKEADTVGSKCIVKFD